MTGQPDPALLRCHRAPSARSGPAGLRRPAGRRRARHRHGRQDRPAVQRQEGGGQARAGAVAASLPLLHDRRPDAQVRPRRQAGDRHRRARRGFRRGRRRLWDREARPCRPDAHRRASPPRALDGNADGTSRTTSTTSARTRSRSTGSRASTSSPTCRTIRTTRICTRSATMPSATPA